MCLHTVGELGQTEYGVLDWELTPNKVRLGASISYSGEQFEGRTKQKNPSKTKQKQTKWVGKRTW